MNKFRTFLSLNINNSLKEKVSEYQTEIKGILNGNDIKWEDPEKFHMTLRFLGDMYENNVEKLSADLENIVFDFEKILFFSDSIDFFPNKRRPNVIFLGFKEEGNNIAVLTNEIDKVILRFGIKPDKKFVPHVTLGRFKRDSRKNLSDKEFPLIEQTKLEFDRFYFMKSIMDYRSSKYFTIKEFMFKG